MPLARIPKQFNETTPKRSAIRLDDEKFFKLHVLHCPLFHALLESTSGFSSRLGTYVLIMDAVPYDP